MLHVKYCLKPIKVFIGFKLNFKGFFCIFLLFYTETEHNRYHCGPQYQIKTHIYSPVHPHCYDKSRMVETQRQCLEFLF